MKGPGALSEEPLGSSQEPGRLRRWLQSYCHRPERVGDHAALAFGGEFGYVARPLDHELHRSALWFVNDLIAVRGRDGLDRSAERDAALDVERPKVGRCEPASPIDQ